MNILLVGSKCRFLQLLTDKLDKEGHRVFLLTAEDKSVRTSKKIFETYHFAYDNPCIREVLEGVRPDVTVFMGAYDTGFLWGKGSSTAVVTMLKILCTAAMPTPSMGLSIKGRGKRALTP